MGKAVQTCYAWMTMNLSQSSRFSDPLSDILTVLARGTRRTRFEGAGEWALAFPALEWLKFVAVLRGAGWFLLPGAPPHRIVAGDCCLIGRTAYGIASDPALVPIDGASLYADGNDLVRLGGDDMVSLGGGISFAPGNAAFLLDMLPTFMHIPAASTGAAAIAAVLRLLDEEEALTAIGKDVVTTRLAEVLMMQGLRAFASTADAAGGWLGALADPRIGRAIQSVHNDIARPWSVADLAAEAGMSRAAFSAAFTRRVGQPPLGYVRAWRMTRARAALAEGSLSVGDVAANVGYRSQSAFGHAFRRTFGAAPRENAR